jgi:hypothetical protein
MLDAESAYNAVPPDARDARTLPGQILHDWMPDQENSLPTWLGGNSPDRQLSDQAQRNFIGATLRQESGAAINQGEYDNQYRIFYPRPGDTAEVLRQKADARKQAIGGFRIAAGPLANQVNAPRRPNGNLTPTGGMNALTQGFNSLTQQMQGKTPEERQAMLARFNADPRIVALKQRAGFVDPGGRTAGAPRKANPDDAALLAKYGVR